MKLEQLGKTVYDFPAHFVYKSFNNKKVGIFTALTFFHRKKNVCTPTYLNKYTFLIKNPFRCCFLFYLLFAWW